MDSQSLKARLNSGDTLYIFHKQAKTYGAGWYPFKVQRVTAMKAEKFDIRVKEILELDVLGPEQPRQVEVMNYTKNPTPEATHMSWTFEKLHEPEPDSDSDTSVDDGSVSDSDIVAPPAKKQNVEKDKDIVYYITDAFRSNMCRKHLSARAIEGATEAEEYFMCDYTSPVITKEAELKLLQKIYIHDPGMIDPDSKLLCMIRPSGQASTSASASRDLEFRVAQVENMVHAAPRNSDPDIKCFMYKNGGADCDGTCAYYVTLNQFNKLRSGSPSEFSTEELIKSNARTTPKPKDGQMKDDVYGYQTAKPSKVLKAFAVCKKCAKASPEATYCVINTNGGNSCIKCWGCHSRQKGSDGATLNGHYGLGFVCNGCLTKASGSNETSLAPKIIDDFTRKFTVEIGTGITHTFAKEEGADDKTKIDLVITFWKDGHAFATVAIEIDKDQHHATAIEDENTREKALASFNMRGRPTLFVRFNPDTMFTVPTGRAPEIKTEERLSILHCNINLWLFDVIHKKGLFAMEVTVMYCFYDHRSPKILYAINEQALRDVVLRVNGVVIPLGNVVNWAAYPSPLHFYVPMFANLPKQDYESMKMMPNKTGSGQTANNFNAHQKIIRN